MIPTELALEGRTVCVCGGGGLCKGDEHRLASLGFITWPTPFVASGSLKVLMKTGEQRSL